MIVEELIGLLGFDLKGEEKLRRFTSGLQGAGMALGAFAARAAVFATAAATAVGSGMAALGVSAVKVGADFEDLQAVLETIEGSSEKAKASLDWVEQFATRTPYDLKKVSDAFVALKAYGLEPQSGLLESIGNATSAMNKDLLQGVEAVADAVRGENERLKEFGIVAKVAGDKVTYSWDQNGKSMTKTVAKNSAEMQKAIVGIFDARFFAAMEKKAGTFNGIISNIGDIWTNFQRRIADAGLFEWVKGQFSGFLKTLQTFIEDGTLDRLAKSISDTLVAAGEAVKDLFSSVSMDDVVGFIAGSIRFLVGIGKVVSSIGQAVAAIGRFVSGLLGLESTWKGVAIVLGGIAAVFAPWAAAFAGVVLLVDDFIGWLQGRPSLIGKALDAIKGVFTAWGPSIKAVWNDVLSVLRKAPQFKFIEGLTERLKAANLEGVFKGWSETASKVWDAISKLGSAFGDLGTALGKLMMDDGGQPTLLARYSTALGQLAGSTLLAGLQVLQGVIRSVANGMETLAGVLSRLAQGDLAGAFGEFAAGAKRQADLVISAVEGMIKAFIPDFSFEEKWNEVIAWFNGFAADVEALAQRVKTALSNMFPEPPEWWKKLTGADTERQNTSDAGKKIGGMLKPKPAAESGGMPKPKQAADNGVPTSTIQDLTNIAATLQNVSGPQATEKAVNTVANDNRVTTVNNTVNAPVQVNATTNATPAQIGQAAGNGVQRAGSNINRNLAVTSAPGGMAK